MLKLDIPQALVVSWIYIIVTVGVALAANALAAKWGTEAQSNWLNPWLWPMLAISPLVFITFGLTASRTGLALGAANVDSMLTVVTVIFGLIVLREWKMLSLAQYGGLLFVLVGIALLQFEKAPSVTH